MSLQRGLIVINIFLFQILLSGKSDAQIFSVEVIHSPDKNSDSSIYDIIKIDDTRYLMSGKNGFLQIIDSENRLHQLNRPTNSSLLKAVKFGENKVIVAGTDGILLIIDKESDSIIVKQLPEFANDCFYDLLVINDSSLVLAGGHNKMVKAKKSLPRGFIIETNDFGETWNYVFRNPFRMVWDIEKDSKNSLIASTYSPFNTKIINIKQNFRNTILKCKTLVHNIELGPDDSTCFLAGSRKHNYKKTASVLKLNKEKVVLKKEFENKGMFWDLTRIGDYYFAVGYGGMIYRIDQEGNLDAFDTHTHESLYELVQITENSFFTVGSNQTILKVNILKNTSDLANVVIP